jgi:chromosome segregation ATPase
MQLSELITDLKSRLSSTTGKLVELREGRRPYALDAAKGDAKAKKAIAAIDADVAATTSEVTTLEVAIEEAERRAIEEAQAEQERTRQLKIAEANEIVTDLEATNAKADTLMEELAQVLDRRQALASDLARTGVVYSGALKALQRQSAIQAAAWFWGLSDHLGIDVPGSASQRLPLAASSVVKPDLVGCQETGVIPAETILDVVEDAVA